MDSLSSIPSWTVEIASLIEPSMSIIVDRVVVKSLFRSWRAETSTERAAVVRGAMAVDEELAQSPVHVISDLDASRALSLSAMSTHHPTASPDISNESTAVCICCNKRLSAQTILRHERRQFGVLNARKTTSSMYASDSGDHSSGNHLEMEIEPPESCHTPPSPSSF